ncbi:metallophosphoesterase [Methylotenera oryzisoli]|uniref:Metallophosphoesterase n=1 Tax=Methylotenera oryzisoli TaxID=2080758 RepID=A0A4Y9VTL0_9PROT|nr:metallophosphoesterase [Methylotenera oryzisoli]TFW72350.1 metallophosphoesterase [Methylotenera oryzisoli]
MKILILSDLHLEFASFSPSSEEVDLIILAGDIWKKDQGIYWARETWPNTEIIYVAGNHEFYGSDRSAVLSLLRSAAEDTGVYFLDNDEVIINDIRFLGTTLWTDFELFGSSLQEKAINVGKNSLNDFRMIVEGNDTFTPNDAMVLCNRSSDWLRAKLITVDDISKTVVVTHHLPSMQSVSERYQNDILSACFASNLDELLGYSKLWIHGHTHDSFDYIAKGTRVICNPRGYIYKGTQENLKFNPGLIVEI